MQVNDYILKTYNMARSTFSVRLPDALRADVEALCKALNRSRGYVAEKALSEYVRWNAWKSREIKSALKQAEKGEFISHEAMTTWAKSLGTDNELPSPVADVFMNSRA